MLGGDGDLKDERRDVTRARYLEGHVAGRVLHDAIRGVRDGQARRSHDRDGMGSGQPQHGRVIRAIRRPREPGRHGALQDDQRALAPVGRNGVPHARSQSRRPAVHDDHPFGREQRTVHERAVPRLLEVVRQEALEAGDGPFG